MVSREYRDGVKALLELKKKDEKDKSESVEEEKKDDNNVEAAVLRFVAGTLDSGRKKRKKSFGGDEMSEFQHWNAFLNTDQLAQGEEDRPKKKRKEVNVDPELAQLDDTTDHEQLVRAAIRDANQLAQDVDIQDFIHQPQDEQQEQGIDNNIIQAAAVAVQQQERDRKRAKQPQQAASGPDATTSSEASALVAAAASKASNWVQSVSQSQSQAQTHGQMFSEEEIAAIDKFIQDYCKINNFTREQICERVWGNERKKDDFWDLLHKVLPYRTRASVYKHVRRTYHVFEVRGKWTPEEDAELARLAAEKDGQWKVIGETLGRMPEDCRDRWRNYVKCGKNRAQNKWSLEEEEKLKHVIEGMIEDQSQRPLNGETRSVINWTAVSEAIGGIRSRIQCRYKWNKLLKRQALTRALSIDYNDRIWLLNKLQELRFEPATDVDWDSLATLHPKNEWTGSDLRLCYEKMRSNIRDFKKKNIMEICRLLLQDFVQTHLEKPDDGEQTEIPVVIEQFEEKPRRPQPHRQQGQTNTNEPTEEFVWR